MTELLLWIASQCIEISNALSPETATDERIMGILAAMQTCRSEKSRHENIDLLPDFRQLDNHYIRWRSFLEQISRGATWLRAETRRDVAGLSELLPAYLMREKYRLTFDCFSSRIGQWKRDLDHFAGAPDLRFLEIGSWEGNAACWLLDNILTNGSSSLVCIDKFTYRPAESLFDLNMSVCEGAARMTKITGLSEDELVKLEKGSFDFIYVDGCHEQTSVLQDAVLAWRLLKQGGIMTFDDYKVSEDPLFNLAYGKECPEIAINAFLEVFKGNYRLLHKGYQVTIQKLHE